MNMFKKNGGFTLVELIVVIAILAILAGIAVPAYSGYITKAQDAAVVTELDAIQTAVQAANATAGSITTIELNEDGTEIKITAAKLADDFVTDFNTFYGGTLKSGTTDTITLTKALELDGTSYAKGATWHASKDTASPSTYDAGWNANE